MVQDCDRLTARVFDSATRDSGARLDAYRDGDSFVVDIDLPGADPAGIDVTVERANLIVRAERRSGGTDRQTGTCTRHVALSEPLDTDRLEARHDNGVLTLTIPITGRRGRRTVAAAA